MKFRLLQARNPGDPVREEERLSFAARLKVSPEQIIRHDLMAGPNTLDAVATGVDAVLVGGSGEYSIYHDTPWIPSFVDLLAQLSHKSVPTFASCFGFQGLVMALGGTVEKDESRAEVGTFEVFVNDAGTEDLLFHDLPTRFNAQLGHKDHAIQWPDGTTCLAYSERCPYQALRVDGKPIYATQFHPELSHTDNLLRFQRYEDHYVQAFGRERYDRMVEQFYASEEASSLLPRFVERVLKGSSS